MFFKEGYFVTSLKDLAAASGVSIRTVNRVLKREGDVAEGTRKRVMDAARALGYRPNLAARALKTGQSYEIAVLMGAVTELHIAKLAAFEEALRAAGYRAHMLFVGAPNDAPAAIEILHSALAQNPAAVALFPGMGRLLPALADALAQTGVPFLALDGHLEEHPCILINRPVGVAEAIRYLADQGRERIVYLGNREDDTRLPGYLAAMRELDRPARHWAVPLGDATADLAGESMVAQMLREAPELDAIQVYSDEMAMGVLRGLHRQGVRVPEDVAVVGFDDRFFAALADPPLTTVAQPNRELGALAAQHLLNWIESRHGPPDVPAALSTRLVARASA